MPNFQLQKNKTFSFVIQSAQIRKEYRALAEYCEKKKNRARCLFCNRELEAEKELCFNAKLSNDRTIYICESCSQRIAERYNQLNEAIGNEEFEEPTAKSLPKPSEIVESLSQYIVGQEEAKKILAVAVYNHYKRLFSDAPIEKSNILLAGPTGCGKTLFAKTLAKILNVPFAIADATTLTEAGYVGEDVESCLTALLQNADMDVERAECGIVYIDEIDKIGRKSENPSITRDVSGEGVQNALLKMIEGAVVKVPVKGGRRVPTMELVDMDTSNILFICGGAFAGKNEMKMENNPIGFGKIMDINKEEDQSFIEFGMTPELMGRLPIVVELNPLKEEDYIRILTEPKNNIIDQYKMLLEMDEVTLLFSPDALKKAATLAIAQGSGARGLRSILEKCMLDIMYNAPDYPPRTICTVTSETFDTGIPDLEEDLSEPLIIDGTEFSNGNMDIPVVSIGN